MRQLILILDYTKVAKKIRDLMEVQGLRLIKETGHQTEDETVLVLEYPNGEHAATFPEVRTASAGRKAAKTFMKYCPCTFEDKTK